MSVGTPQAESSNRWTEPLQFVVHGRARPAGSKGGYRGKIFPSNPYVESWMQEVRKVGAESWKDKPLIDQPIRLSAVFYFARPKNHYGSGRNAGTLKASAPKHMGQTPDLTKLVRAIEDALTKVVWVDDALVCQFGEMGKEWSEDRREYAWIRVEPAH